MAMEGVPVVDFLDSLVVERTKEVLALRDELERLPGELAMAEEKEAKAREAVSNAVSAVSAVTKTIRNETKGIGTAEKKMLGEAER